MLDKTYLLFDATLFEVYIDTFLFFIANMLYFDNIFVCDIIITLALNLGWCVILFKQSVFIWFCSIIIILAITGNKIAIIFVVGAVVIFIYLILKLLAERKKKKDILSNITIKNIPIPKTSSGSFSYDSEFDRVHNSQSISILKSSDDELKKAPKEIDDEYERLMKESNERMKLLNKKPTKYLNLYPSFYNELELNDKSALMKLGYNLQKSERERHQILKEKAIPLLGKEKCIKFLEFQIRLKENILTKDYSNAISKWLKDIQFIEDCYENI